MRDLLGDDTRPATRLLVADQYTPYDNDLSLQQPSEALITSLEIMAGDVADRLVADVARRDATSLNQTHSVENMCMLIGGRAGGLAPGQHIRTSGAHPAQALISAMRAAGNPGDTLGEVTGIIPELFG